MLVTQVNNVKVYNLSAGKSVGEWAKSKQEGVQDDLRVELIQNFEMPTSSQNIEITRDGQYIFASGIYPPQIRCFEVEQLSQKFSRHVDSEIIRFKPLTEDFSKISMLQVNRYVEFHARFGAYYKLRIPREGRDMIYEQSNCDLIIGASSPDVYRFNLQLGRFLRPMVTDSTGVNVVRVNPLHQLYGFATENGALECFDPRTKGKIGHLNAIKALRTFDDFENVGQQLSCLEFDSDGINFALGTNTGVVGLFDLRMPQPVYAMDHNYELPIKSISFHNDQHTKYVVSADTKIAKIWDRNTSNRDTGASILTSIEPPGVINDLKIYPNSGLVVMACEKEKIQTFYVPAIGPAPKWASFLDSITEELEEEHSNGIYESYKFITEEELKKLGLLPLVGSELLRPHLHGYYMDMRLYRKAKAVTEPFEWKTFEKELLGNSKQAKKEASGVNANLANKKGISSDDRFAKLFTDKRFTVKSGKEREAEEEDGVQVMEIHNTDDIHFDDIKPKNKTNKTKTFQERIEDEEEEVSNDEGQENSHRKTSLKAPRQDRRRMMGGGRGRGRGGRGRGRGRGRRGQ